MVQRCSKNVRKVRAMSEWKCHRCGTRKFPRQPCPVCIRLEFPYWDEYLLDHIDELDELDENKVEWGVEIEYFSTGPDADELDDDDEWDGFHVVCEDDEDA